VDSDDFDLLDTLAELYDEPYADSSAIPTYRVCQLARQRVTVALSGDGGDEHFAGYRRYRWHMNEESLRSKLPLGLRKPLFGALGRIYPKADWAPRVFRAKTTFESLARNSVEAYLHSVSLTSTSQRQSMFSQGLKRELQGYSAQEVFDHHAGRCPTDDPLSLIQYLDMKTYLVGDILTKVDRASMAHSLEVRVPLLDHKFVEWISGIPANYKLRGSEGKYLLKKALEPHLPKDVLYRPKMGFGVPLGKWFRGPLKDRLRSTIVEGGLAETGLFNQRYLEQLVSDHQSGRREYSAPLWSLLMFQAAIQHDDFAIG
jgi:asparagine synthase (glutamine-hydrolysing)